MSAAMFGAIGGAALGGISNIIGTRARNKAVIGQIEREGAGLVSTMRAINLNREQLDRELGDILSDNALATAKNMATAKVLMSGSGTVGGTTAQVSKQAFMDQILADADTINQARNQEIALLNQAISKRIEFRNRADALRSNIPSPTEAFFGQLTSVIGGAAGGAQLGQSFQGAMAVNTGGVSMNNGVVSGGDATSRMAFRNANFNSYLMTK